MKLIAFDFRNIGNVIYSTNTNMLLTYHKKMERFLRGKGNGRLGSNSLARSMIQITTVTTNKVCHKCPETVEHQQIMTALIYRVCPSYKWRMNPNNFIKLLRLVFCI